MKAADMTPVIRKYPGQFVALTRDRKRVVGKGFRPEEALEEAKKNGFKEPILTKIPLENRNYLIIAN